MSVNTGANSSETDLTNGGVDPNKGAQTGAGSGAGAGQTVSQEEFQKIQSQLEVLLADKATTQKEIASRDAKIAELLKATEATKEKVTTLTELEKKFKDLETKSNRTEFALKNQVPDDLLPYLAGSTHEELSANWTKLSSLIDAKAEEKRKAELGKLGTGITNASTTPRAPESDDDLVKRILGAN